MGFSLIKTLEARHRAALEPLLETIRGPLLKTTTNPGKWITPLFGSEARLTPDRILSLARGEVQRYRGLIKQYGRDARFQGGGAANRRAAVFHAQMKGCMLEINHRMRMSLVTRDAKAFSSAFSAWMQMPVTWGTLPRHPYTAFGAVTAVGVSIALLLSSVGGE